MEEKVLQQQKNASTGDLGRRVYRSRISITIDADVKATLNLSKLFLGWQ